MQPEISVLDNGLRVVSLHYPQFETVSLGIWVNTGSAYETASLNGISHFLEHMVFKGTASRSAAAISEDIENVGGQTNAYTSREFTAFYAKMLKDDLELAVDVLCELVTSPRFAEEELVKEREVVVQEIKQTYDDPGDIVFDYMQAEAFGNQAMGRPILGTAELVRGYGAEELRAYMKTNYAAENMVFCAVGNVDHARLHTLVEKRLGALQAKTSFTADAQRYTGGFFAEKRDSEQAQVVLGFDGFSYTDERYFAAMLLSTVLGGGMSSRLFQEVREKRGLAYSVYSFPTFYTGAGYTGIAAATDREQINKMLPVIVDEIKKISAAEVGNEELKRAKAQVKAAILMSLESSSAVSEKLARQLLLFNRVIPVAETIAQIDAVSAGDIQRTAETIFASRPTCALVGNIDGHLEYDELCRLLKAG